MRSAAAASTSPSSGTTAICWYASPLTTCVVTTPRPPLNPSDPANCTTFNSSDAPSASSSRTMKIVLNTDRLRGGGGPGRGPYPGGHPPGG